MDKLSAALEGVSFGGVTLARLCTALVLLLVGILLRRLALRVVRRLLDRSGRLNPSLKSFLSGAAGVMLWALVLLMVADHLGVPVTTLVALLTVVGAAFSLAVQGVLENLFAGMTLLSTNPLAVEEYVQIGDTAGTVKQLGLFHTVLLTPDGRTVYLPNKTVSTAEIVNCARLPTRRIDLSVSAAYGDEPDAVIAALLRAAETTPQVLEDPVPAAFVEAYDSSSIRYGLLAWCAGADFLDAKHALTRQVFYTFRDAGVTMTYDHLNVHLDQAERSE